MNLLSLAIAVFYPLVQTYWPQQPLPVGYDSAPAAPTYMDDARVGRQVALFSVLGDPSVRSRLVRELAQANSEFAFRQLEKLERSEKNPVVHADILLSMAELSGRKLAKADRTRMKTLFASPSVSDRIAAVRMFLQAGGDAESVFRHLEQEKSDSVIAAAFAALPAGANTMSSARAKQLIASENPALRAASAEFFARNVIGPDSQAVLNGIPASTDLLLKTSVAKGLAANPTTSGKLLVKLAADPALQVRLAVAGSRSLVPDLQTVLRRYASAPELELRAAACASLSAGDAKSFDILLSRLYDPSALIRASAVTGINSSRATTASLRKVIEVMIAHPLAQLPGLDILRKPENAKVVPMDSMIEFLNSKPQDSAVIAGTVDLLGNMVYNKNAYEYVVRQAGAKSYEVRMAVAAAMGKLVDLKNPAGEWTQDRYLNVLNQLSRDTNPLVVAEALIAMGRIGDADFHSRISACLSNLNTSSSVRANAAWALVGINRLESRDINMLKRIAATACIPMENAPPEFDATIARTSCILTLATFKKNGSEPAASAYAAVMSRLNRAAAAGDENGLLADYLRQIAVYEQNGKAEAVQVPPAPVVLSVSDLSAK